MWSLGMEGRVLYSSMAVAESNRGSMVCFCDGEEWVAVELEDEIDISDRLERFVFGPVPSSEEAEEAVSAIQQMFAPIVLSEATNGHNHAHEDVNDKVVLSTNTFQRSLSIESLSDWIEPALHLYISKADQSQEREKVLDAFHMLQINPSIQRIVVSLSSDKDVWNAVMKNDVVQEFKKSFYEVESKQQAPHEGILKWIWDTKLKIMQILHKISRHVIQIFHKHGAKDYFDALGDVFRQSFILFVVASIIVVMNRTHRS